MEEIVEIANPIYDVVFKYMMQNSKVSKLLISKIIDEKIESLEVKPQEKSIGLKNKGFTVVRIDFSAKIITSEGTTKTVLIEIQKAKFLSDIMRFRRYLGHHLMDKEQHTKVPTYNGEGKIKGERKKAIPLIPIYFLGHNIDNNVSAPVIKVNREIIDVIENKKLDLINNEYIESLTYDAYIIQIKKLGKLRNELEQLLKIFDQSNAKDDDSHILRIDISKLPEIYQELIRTLQKAAASQEVRDVMDAEDDLLDELKEKEREVTELFEKAQRAEKEKQEEKEKRQQAEAEKDEEKEKRQQAEAEKQQAEKEKQQAELKSQILKLHYKGKKNIDEISNITKQSKEYIEKVIE